MDKDEDEACEIDSDDNQDDEESKSGGRKKSRLEESVRSSRTATFKSIRNATNNTIAN